MRAALVGVFLFTSVAAATPACDADDEPPPADPDGRPIVDFTRLTERCLSGTCDADSECPAPCPPGLGCHGFPEGDGGTPFTYYCIDFEPCDVVHCPSGWFCFSAWAIFPGHVGCVHDSAYVPAE